MKSNLTVILLIVITIKLSGAQNNFVKSCLRHGCSMTNGLRVEDIYEVIGNNLPPGEYIDNVITAVTYNIDQNDDKNSWETRKPKLCAYLNKLDAMIIGLQQVKEYQLNELKKCLQEYTSVNTPINKDVEDKVYHVIFYRDSGRLSYVSSGSFWLSHTPNITASQFNEKFETRMVQWVRLRFGKRLSEQPITTGFGFTGNNDGDNIPFQPIKVENTFQKVFRLLKLFTNKDRKTSKQPSNNAFYDEPEKVNTPNVVIRYRQFELYVAVTKFNSDHEHVAQAEARVLTKYLRNNVMDRRQFPLILMGDFSFEDDSSMYEFLEQKKWLRNSMISSRKRFPAMTFIHPNKNKESLIDYIWYNRLRSVLAGSMTDITQEYHRPVFSAFVKEN